MTAEEGRSVDDFAHAAIALAWVGVCVAGAFAWLLGVDGQVVAGAVALAWSPIALAVSFALHAMRDRFVPVVTS